MGQYTAYNHVFHYKDHLGNIRMNYAKNPTTHQVEIIDENHYYPFGLKHTNYKVNEKEFIKEDEILQLRIALVKNAPYNYRYNSKEWQDELGLNVYDYGGRIYAPDAPRFWQIDPKAEKYYNISPYVYVADNPVNAIDPTGEEIIFIVRGETRKQDQQLTYRKGNFYHANGKRYNPGKESLSPTMYKVLSAYRQIEKSKDKDLKSQLHNLETSDQKHYIEKSPNGENAVTSLNRDADYFGKPTGTQTEFDFDNTGKTPLETVAHEMRHQFDHDIGNMQDNTTENNAEDPSEIRAVHNENKANDILGKKHRTTYGGKKIDAKKLENPPNNKHVEDVRQ